MKEEENWRNRKKRKTLGKNINNEIFFQKSDSVKKEEEMQNLNAKQV